MTGNLKETRKVIKDSEASFPVLLDSELFSRRVLNVMGTPTTFIIDEGGRIRCRLFGHAEDLEELVKGVIVRL